MSREMARGAKWLALDDPALENIRVAGEQVFMSKEFIQALIPLALSANGEELMKSVWEMMLQSAQAAQGAGGVGTQPKLGVPSSVVPPGATGDATAPAGPTDALMQALGQAMPAGGSALGGAGQGGMPPPSPMTNEGY